MKASELIKELTDLIEEYGDQEVSAYNGEDDIITIKRVSRECEEFPLYMPEYLKNLSPFLIIGDSIN